MSNSSFGADADFNSYGEIIRRRWPWMLLCVLLGIGLALGAFFVLPKTYRSTASVLVSPSSQDTAVANGRTSSSLNLDTEAQIVTSSVVANLATQELGSKADPLDVVKNASVSVPSNSSVLDISYSASTPSAARDGAAAFAKAYLENRKNLGQAEIDAENATVQQRVADLGRTVLKIGQRLKSLPAGSAEHAYQSSRRDLILRQIEAINQQAVSVGSGTSRPGAIITDPQEPTTPYSPKLTLLLPSGLMAGLLLGVLLAFLLERRDRRVRDRRDLERLGLDPLSPEIVVPRRGEIAAPHDSHHAAESMRMLRNALLAQMRGPRGSVMVAPVSKGDAGSSVALNLAATFARSGVQVILASLVSDVEHPVGSQESSAGLADVLQERARLDRVLRPVDGEPGLRLLGPGRDGSLYSELVQSPRFTSLLAELAGRADVLVFDVPALSENADAQGLAAQFDGVVLVASTKGSTLDDIVAGKEQLEHVNARIFGGVVAHLSGKSGAAKRVSTSGA